MINCIIIDDDPVSVNLITHFINNTEGLSLLAAMNNPIEGVNYIRKNNESIDLIFLDVEMPEMSGIELLDSFSELPPVILITSKEKYAVKAFEHKVLHYLVKPVDYVKFLNGVHRVFKLFESDKNVKQDYLFIKGNNLLSKVFHKDILYCEALGDYVKVHTKDKVHVVYSTMKNIEEKLTSNKEFIRIHRSYLINLNFLENFDAETAIVHKQVLPLGNKYKAGLKLKLNII